MSKNDQQDMPRLKADAFQALISRQTGEVVGHNYRWEDGSVQTLWSNGPKDDVDTIELDFGD